MAPARSAPPTGQGQTRDLVIPTRGAGKDIALAMDPPSRRLAQIGDTGLLAVFVAQDDRADPVRLTTSNGGGHFGLTELLPDNYTCLCVFRW